MSANEKPTAAAGPAKRRRKSRFKTIWRRLRRNHVAMVGLTVIVLFALVAACANLIVPQEQTLKMTPDLLKGPSAEHLFGTDHMGRDVFARIIYGSRISLTLGIATTLVSLCVGGFLGAAAGYFGGKVDNIIMRLMDMLMCIPAMLLALAIIAALGTSIVNLLIAITVSSVPGFTRIIRSAILTVVGQEYIEAARAYGMSDFDIIVTQIIPNAIGPIIVQATMSVSGMIITAAGLSFLGMGVQPPNPEWGAMLSDSKNYMRDYPYLVIFPGVSIALAALSLNLLGDGLRDALDPRLKD
jgi:peptide/nickel transport system permease protein